jgi:hypothetical protein
MTPKSEAVAISRRATLDRQLRQIFLACLEVRGILSRGAFEIHSEPDGPNDKANDPGHDVLATFMPCSLASCWAFWLLALISARIIRHAEPGDADRQRPEMAHVVRGRCTALPAPADRRVGLATCEEKAPRRLQ